MLRLSTPGLRAITSGSAAALSPAQALVASLAGKVDALLIPASSTYTAPGNVPGVLVDALGGAITYTAPNTQATPALVTPAGCPWSYLSADGVDDTLVASANQTVAWYCAVFRSPVTPWSSFGSIIDDSISDTGALGNFHSYFGTDFDSNNAPRGVRRNGMSLSPTYDLQPITAWMLIAVSTSHPTVSSVQELFQKWDARNIQLHLAALAIRYTDPTSDQQTQIEASLGAVRDALIATGA